MISKPQYTKNTVFTAVRSFLAYFNLIQPLQELSCLSNQDLFGATSSSSNNFL